MEQPSVSRAVARLSPASLAGGRESPICGRTGSDICRRRVESESDAITRVSGNAHLTQDDPSIPTGARTTSHSCASHARNNLMNSTTRRGDSHNRSQRSSLHADTDTVFTRNLDSKRYSRTCSQWQWPSRRMYMGNIKPWTLGVATIYLLIILSNHVGVSLSSPTSLSHRLVEQRMRRINSLDEYINAFRVNDTTRSVNSRFYINRSPSSVTKRSYRRWGRAGKDSSTVGQDNSFMDRVRDEHNRASCQPRDQVVDAYDELGIPRGYDQLIYPECIVVRRCKQGGCCRDDQECEPSRRTNITMNFLINAIRNTHEIEHDTECECQAKPSFCPPPDVDCQADKVWSYSECSCKCQNRCPKPFLQDETTCGCDCLTKDRTCKNIYRGRRGIKLSREECDCVRKGLCAKPPCINGRFSIQQCKCINSSS